ncbi:hypothetical protein [Sulfurimonas sp.]
MKKITILLLLITTVFANDMELESAIFNTIIHELTSKKEPKVYIHTKVASLQNHPKKLQLLTSCNEADIVIVSNLKDIPQECAGKILFGTRYKHLKNSRVVGAFFWQKGRPNILFYKSRLQHYGIKLSEKFQKYIEND